MLCLRSFSRDSRVHVRLRDEKLFHLALKPFREEIIITEKQCESTDEADECWTRWRNSSFCVFGGDLWSIQQSHETITTRMIIVSLARGFRPSSLTRNPFIATFKYFLIILCSTFRVFWFETLFQEWFNAHMELVLLLCVKQRIRLRDGREMDERWKWNEAARGWVRSRTDDERIDC